MILITIATIKKATHTIVNDVLNLLLKLNIFENIFIIIIKNMTASTKQLFAAAKHISPKAAVIEKGYKILKSEQKITHEFSSLHNEVFLINDYDEFLKVQNQTFALIGKPKSLRRSGFERRLKGENKETKNEYNILMKALNLKNKQFEQDYFNNFLEEGNLKERQNKVFDVNKCKDVI